jgi:molecular chaperone DnaK
MRTLFSIIALSLLAFGCQSQIRAGLVIEDSTPMVGAGRTTTEALGIEILGGMFEPLVNVGTTVPFSVSKVFTTAADGQSQIILTPFRGTNNMASDNHALGRFQIIGIPSAPRGMTQVEVTFSITERQILLSARDLTHKTDLQIQILPADVKP